MPYDDPLLGGEQPQDLEERRENELPASLYPQSTRRLSRSKADEIVEAVGGVAPYRHVRRCPCGSVSFKKISPLDGGTVRLRCKSCRAEVPLATISTRIPGPEVSPQMAPGPFSGQALPFPFRGLPAYRLKTGSQP